MKFNKPLITAAVFVAALIATFTVSAQVVDLQHAEFDAKLNTSPKLVVIDVRSVEEFARGHVPNAVNIPHSTILLETSILNAYQDKEMVFYCHSGRRAKSVTDVLDSNRYTDGRPIYHLQGDFKGWIEAKRPIQQ